MNGTSKAADTASLYAPVTSGTAGQVLKSSGTGTAPNWDNMANYSRVYTAITNTTGKNPASEGWYELVDGSYVLTADTTPDSEKTYYKQESYYEMTF